MIYTVTLNPARDRTVVIENFAAGKVNRVQALRDDPGGKGINVSKVVHTLGGNTVAMGILGGATGKYIRKTLNEMGVNNDFVMTRSETRTNIKVVDPVNHATTDINEPGTPVNSRVLTSVFARLMDCAKPSDIVVFAGKIPAGTGSTLLAEWTKKLKAAGVRVFLDADSRTLAEGVKAAPYLIKPNDAELSELIGEKLTTLSQIHAAAKKVIDMGIKVCAVSMGADGALFVSENEAIRAEGLKVEVKSTVGAGDAMMAALAYGFDCGMSFREACRWAMAAGAANVTCSGTQSAPRELVEELRSKVILTDYREAE